MQTTQDWLVKFLSYGHRHKAWSPRHTETLRYRLAPFCRAFPDVSSITPELVAAWFDDLSFPSNASYNSYRQTFRSFFTWLTKNGALSESPADELPRKRFEKRNKTTSFADFQKLRSQAELLAHSADPIDLRIAAIWFFAAETACRLGEIASLRYGHVTQRLEEPHFTPHGYVYTVRITGKTGEGWVTFTEVAANALRAWLAVRPKPDEVGHNGLWIGYQSNRWGAEMTISGVAMAFERVAGLAGVTQNFSSHCLRYLNCKYYVENYNPNIAQRKLRHHRVEFTLSVYHQVTNDELLAATADGLLQQPRIPTLLQAPVSNFRPHGLTTDQ